MSSELVQPLRRLLCERGLEHWHDVVLDFAGRWDGWQAHHFADDSMSPDHLPLQQVMEALETVPAPSVQADPNGSDVIRERQARELACAQALSGVDMTQWQAMVDFTLPQPWNPLEQSFLSFRKTPGKLVTWEDSKTLTPRSVIRTWLLGRVKEHELHSLAPELKLEE